MTLLALALVFGSAVVHATWNLFAKRVCGGSAFIWLLTIVSGFIYAPLALYILNQSNMHLTLPQAGMIMVSAGLHVAYFILLSRGYRAGDMSLVYPLARGTGPLLSTALAVVLLHEQPTAVALVGSTLIGLGVFILTGDVRKFRQQGAGMAVVYALMTGVTIASYTVWDKSAVSTLLIPPLVFDWVSNLFRALMLTPHAVSHWDEVKRHWREHRFETILVGIFSPLSYILMLTALSFSPVSYVAPAREMSILFGTLLGAKMLSEGDTVRRLAAASVMAVGVMALAFN